MIIIKKILADDNTFKEYLLSKGIYSQYENAKNKLLQGNFSTGLDFKERQPKVGIYSFRINNEYRVLGYLREECFIVVKIDDHNK